MHTWHSVYEMECRPNPQEHQNHVHIVGHQSLLQQHVLSVGSPWGWRLYCSWPSSDAGPSLSFPAHCKFLPRRGPTFRVLWPGFLGLATIAGQHGQVGPIQVGVPTGFYQYVVHHQVHLSEQGMEQQVHGPKCGLPACELGRLNGQPIGFQDLTFKVVIAVA